MDMQRRRFLRASVATAATLGLAGCSGNNAPPPRKARVFDDVSLNGKTMQVRIMSDPVVESRQEEVEGKIGDGGVPASLLPVGVARAAKGAGKRGAGGFSSAPKGRHGWAVWHGGAYEDDWREDHRDELRMYDATIVTMGIAYLGSDNDYENNPPGPGPVDWDKTWNNPDEGTTVSAAIDEVSPGGRPREGWYRVGTELEQANGNTDFGWQGADFEIDNEGNWLIDKAWHVKPRV
jgi:hypothetical protein